MVIECGVFNEGGLGEERGECSRGDEMIALAIYLVNAWVSCGVRYGECECIGILVD